MRFSRLPAPGTALFPSLFFLASHFSFKNQQTGQVKGVEVEVRGQLGEVADVNASVYFRAGTIVMFGTSVCRGDLR